MPIQFHHYEVGTLLMYTYIVTLYMRYVLQVQSYCRTNSVFIVDVVGLFLLSVFEPSVVESLHLRHWFKVYQNKSCFDVTLETDMQKTVTLCAIALSTVCKH